MSSSVNFKWLLTFEMWGVKSTLKCNVLPLNLSWNHSWQFLTHFSSSWVHLKTDVSPVVPFDVHLEVWTSYPLTILESYQPILGSSDLCRPLQSPKKSLWWRVVGENQICCMAQAIFEFEFSELDFAWLWPSWPSPDPHLTWTWTWAWQKCRSKLVTKNLSLVRS